MFCFSFCFKLPCVLPLFGFWQLEHFFSFSFLFQFYAFLLSLFHFSLQVEDVDNALIKEEIESQWTGLIALLV